MLISHSKYRWEIRFGVLTCMNHYLFLLCYPLSGIVHGNFGAPQKFWDWSGRCNDCSKIVKEMKGVFCANYGVYRSGLGVCKSVWCGKCYSSGDDDGFHIQEIEDESCKRWRRAKDETRFKAARNGDHLVVPFQCDSCIFRLLKGRKARTTNEKDLLLLKCIRRVNLDAFWAREPGTVRSQLSGTLAGVRMSEKVGLDPEFMARGPFPSVDTMGYGVAIQMVLKSTEDGKNNRDYQQFDTIRKLKSAHSNIHESSMLGVRTGVSSVGDGNLTLSQGITQSLWFKRFMRGCRLRMGQDRKPNLALDVRILVHMMVVFERAIEAAETRALKILWTRVAAYCVLSYCATLRGHEGFMADLDGLRKYYDRGDGTNGDAAHATLPLRGRFKTEEGERYHLLLLAAVTSSELEPRKWIGKLIMCVH